MKRSLKYFFPFCRKQKYFDEKLLKTGQINNSL